MNRLRRVPLLVFAVVVASIAHALAAHYLAARDPFVALRGHQVRPLALAVAVLAAARSFLLFVAPGWALYRAVMALRARRDARAGDARADAKVGP